MKGERVELESIPLPARERIDQIASADLIVGVLADDGDAPAMVRQALHELSEVPRTVIIQNDGVPGAEGAESEDQRVFIVPWALLGPEASVGPVQSIANAYQSVIAAGQKLGAQVCSVVASDLQTATSQWISRLIEPVLRAGFDLVTPCYAHGKFEGLLNNSLISPLSRALYGVRILNPLGPDLCISRRLFQKLLGPEGGKPAANRMHALASITSTAVCGGFKICQAQLGIRRYAPIDWTNLSSLLVQVLGPVFLDVERTAACWQRARGPVSTPIFGERTILSEDNGAIDVRRMLESFQLGVRDLPEVWSLVLPPTTLLELRKLSRLPQEQFCMPDELWARTVYDFALGHRLRMISRDHLLRAMTPLYLGWVASYALEMENATVLAAEQRIERLCHAFEASKPYLVSRWRWPDRFNS